MSQQTERLAKRARGSYAKLICFRCRERRIKCQLADDGSVQPSNEPQPPEKACVRCKQRGIPCIVRRTTLGRPNAQKRQALPTPSSTESNQRELRSPSPRAEDLVLLTIDDGEPSLPERQKSVECHDSTGVHMFGAMCRTFDLTSGLLARDKRFGSSIAAQSNIDPRPLAEILNPDLIVQLDSALVWHRIYMPWLPSLLTVYQEVCRKVTHAGSDLPAALVLALLSSIALDIPLETLSAHRQLQRDIQYHIYHTGQKVLFTLPRHEYTLLAMELVHGHRPLALINSQEAAAHTLSGNLYGTIIQALAPRLGLDSASWKLQNCLRAGGSGDVRRLVIDTLRWCATLMYRIYLDLEEVDTATSEAYAPAAKLTNAFEIVAEAIDLGYAPTECFFAFHAFRYHADELLATRDITVSWNDLTKLEAHITAYKDLRSQRQIHFNHGLAQLYLTQGRAEEALALSQLTQSEQNQGYTNVIGFAMFYAILSGAHSPNQDDNNKYDTVIEWSKRYTERVNAEASSKEESAVQAFIDRYGDEHMDGLERRLTDFINVASDLQLGGVPYVGPPRHTSTNVLMACKEIVENNAVRIKIDGTLHSRVDMQLILFQEAARRLEAMEADGGSTEAIARGSVFTASAKLIRNLHRIMWQWKRNYSINATVPCDQLPSKGLPQTSTDLGLLNQSVDTSFTFAGDDPLADGFFTDWDNWPQLGPTELSNMFTYEFDAGNV